MTLQMVEFKMYFMEERFWVEQNLSFFGHFLDSQPGSGFIVSLALKKGNNIRMKFIKIYHETFKEEKSIDDITWDDLEMDKVFSELNHTKCYIGEQILYKRVHELDAGRDWNKFEEQILYLQQHSKERGKITKQLGKLGKCEESYYLPVFMKNMELLRVKNNFVYHFLQLLMLSFIVAGVITGKDIFLVGILAVAAVNLVIYMCMKGKYEVHLYSLGNVRQIVDISRKLISKQKWKEVFAGEDVEEAVKALNKVSRGIGGFESRKRGSLAGDPGVLLCDYLFGITLYDISVFNYIMKVLDKKLDKLLILYQFVGELDMANAVAVFREQADGVVCVPDDKSDEKKLLLKGLRHPLVKSAVLNDFDSEGRVMISGANASGKSTFMKAVAINVILAQTIHTCTASRVKIPALFVMTSMALRDDVLSGESYYIREVKYLKRMIEAVEKEQAVLCMIDEILKGTNTRERLAASEAILRFFSQKNGMVMVATHDMELVEKMKNDYECYYFESRIEKQDIHFDYVLHKGIGGKSNAIALLELLGYPKSIVERARKGNENW